MTTYRGNGERLEEESEHAPVALQLGLVAEDSQSLGLVVGGNVTAFLAAAGRGRGRDMRLLFLHVRRHGPRYCNSGYCDRSDQYQEVLGHKVVGNAGGKPGRKLSLLGRWRSCVVFNYQVYITCRSMSPVSPDRS